MATGVRKCFFFVKENVSSDWKNLAYHLGFGRADIDNISSRNPDSKSCCMDLLEEWQQRKGDRATKEVLVEALTEANLQSVVDGLKMDYTDLQVGLHLGLRQQPATSVKEQYLERILELERTLFTVKVLNDPVRYRKVRKTFNAHKALLKKAVDGSIILLLTFLCQSDVDGFYHNHFRVGEGSLSQQLSDILITDELQKKVKGVQLIVRLHVKHEDYVRVRTRLGQGLHCTTSVDNLRTLPTRSCHLDHSSLRALDLAVVNGEDQACTVGVDGISSLNFTVKEVQAFARAGKGKSQQVRQLEDKLQVMRGQLHTARQETDAITEEVTRLKENDEKAQKLVSEQKLEIQQLQETNKSSAATMERMTTAEQDTQALVRRLANEADRLKHEDEKAQKTLQEQKLEIQQLQEANKSMATTIEDLLHAKHTAKGQEQMGKMADPGKKSVPGQAEHSGKLEAQSGLEDRESQHEPTGKCIDEYGTSKGGVYTINCQAGQTLAAAKAAVYCTALRVPKQDQDAADRDGVKLIPPVQLDKESVPTLDWLDRVHYPNLPKGVTCIIGHAGITDTAARNIWEQRYPQADLMTFNHGHAIPEDTEYYKGGREVMNAWEKEKGMLDNVNNAKAAFSVGQRTYDHFDTIYKAGKKPENHYVFLPKPSEIFLATTVRPGGQQKVVLCIGRVSKAENLKGHDLAVQTMGEVVKEIRNARLRLRGISEDDWEARQKILEDNVKSSDLNPTLLPYGTQEDIRDDMMRANLFLMPSRTEPFGLVGLEAIAAGIPVLIADKTGLAEMILDLITKGKLSAEHRHVIVETCVNDSDRAGDVKRWATRIVDTLKFSDSEFAKAARLKRELVESRYWEESHRTFLQACGIPAGAADM
uniref:Death domain-containing protein n=1 Tax=Branchiostoma floridae TaxID=7739 RepID=C3ZDU8_BRAFL|eukprot:XP_002592893.1 hypothetical protein BRAFLDRAFT_65479 [Branchiostoma floridae]